MEIDGKAVDGFVIQPGDKLVIQVEPGQPMDQILQFEADLNRLLTPMGIEYVAIATRQILVVRDGGKA